MVSGAPIEPVPGVCQDRRGASGAAFMVSLKLELRLYAFEERA